MVAEKGSGDLTIEFACDEIPSFWGALIAGDEPKRGANDLFVIIIILITVQESIQISYNAQVCYIVAIYLSK